MARKPLTPMERLLRQSAKLPAGSFCENHYIETSLRKSSERIRRYLEGSDTEPHSRILYPKPFEQFSAITGKKPGEAPQTHNLRKKRLKELLHYDPDTGLFRWAYQGRRVKKGTIAGWRDSDGYVRINLDRRSYMAHRLAWLYEQGTVRVPFIIHRNGVRWDNRIKNLLAADMKHILRLYRPVVEI